jgi:hypothetical protein
LLLHTANGAAASGHRSSGVLQPQLPPDKLSRLPNVPLLDVCTGQWRGLWDLFPVKARGCYLGTLSLSPSLLRRFFFSFSYPPPFRPRNRAQLLRSVSSVIFVRVPTLQGAVVVVEFYLSTAAARCSGAAGGPTVAVDP